jgi:hypothetical protein
MMKVRIAGRGRATRYGACATLVAAVCIVVIGCSAQLRWDTPLWPREDMTLPARDFRVAMGAGAEDGNALHVGAIGDDGNSVQVHALDHLRARDFPILRYRFEGFPRTLELALIFRRADEPGDVHAISVPWPGEGTRAVDLRGVDAWRGEIIEIGFAEFATGQLVPASEGFRPFRFDSAQLCSLSWRDGLMALRAAWFGYQPWALMSISALVSDRGTSGTRSPLLALIALGALGLLALALALRWPWRRVLGHLALLGAALWIALDARWLADLGARHSLTERVYAGRPWEERQQLQPDENVAQIADKVREWLGGNSSAQRLLVDADSDYVYLRLMYLLLPRNVGLLHRLDNAAPPPDTLILLYASSRWVYDSAHGVLRGAKNSFPVDPVFEAVDAHLYRVRGNR